MQWFVSGMMVMWWTLLGMAAATAQQPPPPIPGETVSAGRQYFVRYCSACHGDDRPRRWPSRPGPAYATCRSHAYCPAAWRALPRGRDCCVIDGRTVVPAHGSREMPIWGERFGEMVGGGSVGEEVVRGNLLVLIEYLQSIQQ